jgi:hypothetical protein
MELYLKNKVFSVLATSNCVYDPNMVPLCFTQNNLKIILSESGNGSNKLVNSIAILFSKINPKYPKLQNLRILFKTFLVKEFLASWQILTL